MNGEVVCRRNKHQANRRMYIWKRCFDSLVVVVASPVWVPVCAIVALLVKLSSPGPVLFTQMRVGRGLKPFRIYKYRTMVVDAERRLQEMLKDPQTRAKFEKDYKLKNDPRINPTGGFLRKTSLDELPQLINVLLGQMSLVGPRPIVEDEIAKYGDAAPEVFTCLPGLTGLWQVSGRNDIPYAERVQLDLTYARSASPWLDLQVLFRTAWIVLSRKGAF